MVNQHIDITRGFDGETVVLACFDLDERRLAASAYGVVAAIGERYRTSAMSTDDVLALRELTALADELGDLALTPGLRTVVMRPARLSAYRDALAYFVESRDTAEWLREDDREPLAAVRGLVAPLEDLCADALRAALTGGSPARPF
jgi:hypothetical protein